MSTSQYRRNTRNGTYASSSYARPLRNSYAARQQEFEAPKFYQIGEGDDYNEEYEERGYRSSSSGRRKHRTVSGAGSRNTVVYRRRQGSMAGRQGSVNRSAAVRRGNIRQFDDYAYDAYGRPVRRIAGGYYGDDFDQAQMRQERGRARKRKSGPKFVFTTKSRVGNGYLDFNLLMAIFFLVVFGLVMLYSTSYYSATVNFGDGLHYFKRQAAISLGSLGVMYFISRIDYHFWKRFAFLAYAGSMFCVLLLLTPLGITKNEATRWIGVTDTLSFQPAELCKLAVILFIPTMIMKMNRKFRSLKALFILMCFGALPAFLVLVISSNLSSAAIIGGITLVMAFIVFPAIWPFVVSIGGLGGLAAVLIKVVIANMENSDNYRFRRIIAWLNPEKYASSLSYQTMQALYAIGSGGLFGKGLGNSTQKMIIPEVQNDMIFSVICEELGMFGVAIVFLLFGVLLYRLMLIVRHAPDFYGSLIVIGIFAHIAIQVILNVAVVTNVMPNTGITLPFISYGGTSVLFLMAEMGLALNVSRQIEWKD